MNHHHPIKKLNLPSQSPNIRMSLYDNIKHHHNLPSTTIITAPTYNRILTRKIPHSLDKLNKKHYQLDTSPLQKQLLTPNAKKLSSYQSTKNIHRNNPALTDNNNSNNNDISLYHHLNNFTTIMNRSALGINNINNSTSNINNYTHSNLNNQSSSKVKERLIQNLKNNFSQERTHKKKMLSVNVNVNLNQHYAMINNNNNNNNTTDTNGSSHSGNANAQHHAYTHSFYDNNTISNISLYKRNYFGKKEQPLKLYTDANAFNNHTHSNSNKKKSHIDNRHTSNNNNNNNCSFGDAFDNSKLINSTSHNNLSISTSNTTVISTIIEKFIELESKMTKLLKENKTNSKSKKYNTAKQIFEETITHITTITTFLSKHLPDNKDTLNPYIIPSLLKTIIKTYHESFFAFSTENKILRENVEKFQSSTFHLEKRILDVSKQLKQKESEIDSLKSQITKLSKQQQQQHIITPNRNNTSSTANSPSITQQHQQPQLQLQMPCDPRQVTFSALDDDLVNSSNPPLNRHQALIKDYNTKNVNDLDALYFNDKVEMKESTRDTAITGASSTVPKLNLNTMHNGNGSSNSSSIGLVNISFNANKIINKGNI